MFNVNQPRKIEVRPQISAQIDTPAGSLNPFLWERGICRGLNKFSPQLLQTAYHTLLQL